MKKSAPASQADFPGSVGQNAGRRNINIGLYERARANPKGPRVASNKQAPVGKAPAGTKGVGPQTYNAKLALRVSDGKLGPRRRKPGNASGGPGRPR